MLQPPQGYQECPLCGEKKAILIMDFHELLPQLDSMGYPQYYCPSCANVFTGLDIPQDKQGKDTNTDENKEGQS